METLFSKYDLEGTRRNKPQSIRDEIDKLGENYLLNVSENDLVDALSKKHEWDPPVLGEPQIASHQEVIRDRNHSNYGYGRMSSSYQIRLTQIIVQVPYTGDKTFFQMRPTQSQWPPPQANIQPKFLEIIYEEEALDSERIRKTVSQPSHRRV